MYCAVDAGAIKPNRLLRSRRPPVKLLAGGQEEDREGEPSAPDERHEVPSSPSVLAWRAPNLARAPRRCNHWGQRALPCIVTPRCEHCSMKVSSEGVARTSTSAPDWCTRRRWPNLSRSILRCKCARQWRRGETRFADRVTRRSSPASQFLL